MRARLLFVSLLLLTIPCFASVSYKNSYLYAPGTGNETQAQVSGDFNHDGWPDIAFVSGEHNPSFVTIVPGSPAGFKATGNTYDIGAFPAEIQTADINNDGNLDLVISYATDSNMPDAITILYGNGDGTFRSGPEITFAEPVLSFALGDVNNNGTVDLAVLLGTNGSPVTAATMEVLLNDGSGKFTESYKVTMAAAYATDIHLADLNGDGNLDVVNIRGNQVLIWLGKGNGTFASPLYLTPTKVCDGSSCSDVLENIAIADFNNDGYLDLAVVQAHACGSACGDNTVYVYKNNGKASFTMSSFAWEYSAGIQLLASDVNGDQNMDLVGYNGSPFGGSSAYALNNGSGTFGTPTAFNLQSPAMVIDRDLNLDSRHDLVAADWQDDEELIATNTGAYTNCAPPSSATIGAKICSPAGGTLASPVLVKASGNSPAGVQRLEVWIDGVKKAQAWTDQIAKKFTLTPGSHRIAVIAVDKYEGSAETVVNVTVQ